MQPTSLPVCPLCSTEKKGNRSTIITRQGISSRENMQLVVLMLPLCGESAERVLLIPPPTCEYVRLRISPPPRDIWEDVALTGSFGMMPWKEFNCSDKERRDRLVRVNRLSAFKPKSLREAARLSAKATPSSVTSLHIHPLMYLTGQLMVSVGLRLVAAVGHS